MQMIKIIDTDDFAFDLAGLVNSVLDAQPEIDCQWIPTPRPLEYVCTRCDSNVLMTLEEVRRYRFCPICGAKARGIKGLD